MMNERDHVDHVGDLIGAYVLGATTSSETREVEEHLRTCALCRRLESELRDVESLLPRLAGEASPPAALKGRLMTIVQAEAPARRRADETAPSTGGFPHLTSAPPSNGTRDTGQGQGQGQAPSPITPLPVRRGTIRRSSRFLPLLAAAAVLAIVVVGAGIWTVVNGSAPQQVKYAYAARVKGAAFPLVTGTLSYNRGSGTAQLKLYGLKPIPSNRVYELWLIGKHGAVATVKGVGVFSPRSGGQGSYTLKGQNVRSYAQAALTIERAPGSSVPTLPIVAAATLQA